jgi:hypothetical protein
MNGRRSGGIDKGQRKPHAGVSTPTRGGRHRARCRVPSLPNSGMFWPERCPWKKSINSVATRVKPNGCARSRAIGCSPRSSQHSRVCPWNRSPICLRAFNHQNGVTVAYKAFYYRLARAGFAAFMREMRARLVERLSIQTLTSERQRTVARFKDIVIQDGSSFALKATLHGTFPGRFTTIEPAPVEVHATYSGFFDEVQAVQIAPDANAERQCLPDPSMLQDRLLLADRSYPSVAYSESVREQGGSFIVRLTRSYDRWVRSAWVDGRRVDVATLLRLSRWLPHYSMCAWTSTSSSNAMTASSGFA